MRKKLKDTGFGIHRYNGLTITSSIEDNNRMMGRVAWGYPKDLIWKLMVIYRVTYINNHSSIFRFNSMRIAAYVFCTRLLIYGFGGNSKQQLID